MSADSEAEGASPLVASDFLKCAGADDNFFKNIATGNETWICSYDPETKQP